MLQLLNGDWVDYSPATKHLPGQHAQESHAGGFGAGVRVSHPKYGEGVSYGSSSRYPGKTDVLFPGQRKMVVPNSRLTRVEDEAKSSASEKPVVPKPQEASKPAVSSSLEFGGYTVSEGSGVTRAAQKIFGRKVSAEDLADLSGAPKGSHVELLEDQGEIRIAYREYDKGQEGRMSSYYVYKADDGSPGIYAKWIQAKGTPPGTGTRMFARTVKVAINLGISELRMQAAGAGLNGYYTWARLGVNGEIYSNVRSALPPKLKDAKDIHDLMSKPGGTEWWKANGGDFNGEMSLKPNSAGLKIMKAYLAAKGIEV